MTSPIDIPGGNNNEINRVDNDVNNDTPSNSVPSEIFLFFRRPTQRTRPSRPPVTTYGATHIDSGHDRDGDEHGQDQDGNRDRRFTNDGGKENEGEDIDDEASLVPSELSTLIATSTLTPNMTTTYHAQCTKCPKCERCHHCHHINDTHTNGYACAATTSTDSPNTLNTFAYSRKAFRLAAVFGMLSMMVLLCVESISNGGWISSSRELESELGGVDGSVSNISGGVRGWTNYGEAGQTVNGDYGDEGRNQKKLKKTKKTKAKKKEEDVENELSKGVSADDNPAEAKDEENDAEKKAKAEKTTTLSSATIQSSSLAASVGAASADDSDEDDDDDDDDDDYGGFHLEDDDDSYVVHQTTKESDGNSTSNLPKHNHQNQLIHPDLINKITSADTLETDNNNKKKIKEEEKNKKQSKNRVKLHKGMGQSVDDIPVPMAQQRCPYVIDTFQQLNEDVTNIDFLRQKYMAQSVDPNVFYRATALLFWKDFGAGLWGVGDGTNNATDSQSQKLKLDDLVLLSEATYEDGTPMSPMSTWTWITGDQHLSNFGAWRNRGKEIVFSVNDFDEAAIYDFHIDVLRIAVSICSHGFTNRLELDKVKEALEAFTYTYVKTVIDYVGGDAALVFELNPQTSTGVLRDFLWEVESGKSQLKQLEKFTELDENGVRRFSRTDRTRLVDVPKEVEEKIRAELISTRYGASMMKMGWKVRGWDDDFFTVLDVARRVGSGVGSYGVDRFYVLLKGTDTSLDEVEGDPSVILDVKYEPTSAVSRILDENTKAWYGDMFKNEADRAAQGQRHLTSYTDPFVGWIEIDGNPYSVRQRSPWKDSFDLDKLTDPRVFAEFIEEIAIATATSHVRGTVSKSPGQFKHVIKLLLAGEHNRRRWSNIIARIALHYRNQVLLDYKCFKEYVESGAAFVS